MSTILAAGTGNWSATGTWTGGVVPTTGDVAVANNKTVTIDQNITVSELRNDTTGSATAGGGFTVPSSLSGTRNITANVYAGTANSAICLSLSHTTGNTVVFVGNVTGGSGNGAHGISNTSTGTLTFTGTITGGTVGPSHGLNNNSSGTVNITGNSTASSGSSATHGTNNASSGTVNITGNGTGGTSAGCCGITNAGSGTINITGNATGGGHGSAYGVYNSSSGTTAFVSGGIVTSGSGGPGLHNIGSGIVTGITRGVHTNGYFPFGGRIKFSSPLSNSFYIDVQNVSDATIRIYPSTTLLTDSPANADVRYGTTYQSGGQTGSLRVPAAASVLYGVPVDDTTGTATATAFVSLSVGSNIHQLSLLDTSALTNQNIVASHLVYTHTAAAAKSLVFEIDLGGVAGNGYYLLGYSLQIGGAGTVFRSPTQRELLDSSTNSAIFTTAVIPVQTNDVVKMYVQGQAGDTSVSVTTRVYDANVSKTDYALTSAYDAAKTASQFDPATDTVAHVTLVDTTTDLTNGGSGGATAQEVWEYTTRALTDKTDFALTEDYNGALLLPYNNTVWIDTIAGTEGTVLGVNGLQSLPVLTLADALTIADAAGITSLSLAPGSLIGLTRTHNGWQFKGGAIGLNWQDVGGSYFEGCAVNGVDSDMGSAMSYYRDCHFPGGITVVSGRFENCSGVVETSETSRLDYMIINPMADTASSSGAFEIHCGNLNKFVVLGLQGQLRIFGLVDGDYLTVYGEGNLVLADDWCTGGTIVVGANIAVTDMVEGGFQGTITRLPTIGGSGGVTAQEVWEYTTRALTDKTGFVLTSDYDAAKTAASQLSVDAIPTAPLLAEDYEVPPSVEQIRTEMDTNSTKLANLDAAVSSRLASASYTAPANDNITAIKEKTDNLPDQPAAVGSEMTLTSAYDAAKTASQFNSATDTVAHVTLVDTATTLTNSPDVPTPGDIADAVRTELATELARIDEDVSAPKTLTLDTLQSIITSMPEGLSAQQVWTYIERTVTGGTVDTLVNSPNVPAPEDIATAVRTELEDELARVANCATVETVGEQLEAFGV